MSLGDERAPDRGPRPSSERVDTTPSQREEVTDQVGSSERPNAPLEPAKASTPPRDGGSGEPKEDPSVGGVGSGEAGQGPTAGAVGTGDGTTAPGDHEGGTAEATEAGR